jgi:hypothetical protein
MNVASLNVTPDAAQQALKQYKAHRGSHDKNDWEIERIYRQIAKGKTVISIVDAIMRGGHDEMGRPRLAIARADDTVCYCQVETGKLRYAPHRGYSRRHFQIACVWAVSNSKLWGLKALLPRIPPQHRPLKNLSDYHVLWEASWTDIPRDPYLLRRIGKDAWIVLAAWDLTDVEISVLRAHRA